MRRLTWRRSMTPLRHHGRPASTCRFSHTAMRCLSRKRCATERSRPWPTTALTGFSATWCFATRCSTARRLLQGMRLGRLDRAHGPVVEPVDGAGLEFFESPPAGSRWVHPRTASSMTTSARAGSWDLRHTESCVRRRRMPLGWPSRKAAAIDAEDGGLTRAGRGRRNKTSVTVRRPGAVIPMHRCATCPASRRRSRSRPASAQRSGMRKAATRSGEALAWRRIGLGVDGYGVRGLPRLCCGALSRGLPKSSRPRLPRLAGMVACDSP